MESILQDIRFGWRMLLRSPVFALAAISTLALGIGANTAIFSIVDGVVLRPLPYEEPERLVMAWTTSPAKGQDTPTPNDYLDWRNNSTQFYEHLAAFCYQGLNLVEGDVPEQITGASVTSDFFNTLGISPVVGRTWQTSANEERVTVLGYGLWERRFAKDPQVIGRRIKLNDESYEVLGVMPKGFRFPDRADLWVPAPQEIPVLNTSTQPQDPDNLSTSYLRVVGRLKPGVSLEQAQAGMDSIASRRAREYPDTNAGLGVELLSLHEQIVGNVRTSLLIVLGAVSFVLIIACVNVANLLLARAGVRKREVGIRMALGAGRGRLIRQLLSESVLLSFLSGALGLLFGYWGLGALVRLSPPDTPRIAEVGLDARVLLFTFGIALFTGLLFGLLPAIQTSNPEFGRVLVGGGRTMTEGRKGLQGRNLLMAVEVAFSLILLVGAGLMIKSFLRLNNVGSGFNPDNALAFKVALPRAKYDKPRRVEFFRQAQEKLQTLPGVQGTALVLSLPLSGDDINQSFVVEGRAQESAQEQLRDGYQVVSPGYFSTMEIPLLRGRNFTEGDVKGAPEVAIISEGMAKRYWPDRDPIGQRVTFDEPDDPEAVWITIVGIVGDVRFGGLAEEGRAELYRPYPQDAWSAPGVVVRLAEGRDPLSLVPSVRAQIASIDPEQPISEINTLEQMLAASVARPRVTSRLLGAFAFLALLLAAIGIYGLIAYTVSRRTHEIGIRMALGAQRPAVLGQVMTQGIWITLIGIALGLFGAFASTRLLASLLFEVSSTDMAIFIGGPLLLLLVAILASLIPAYRASRIDPLTAFRTE